MSKTTITACLITLGVTSADVSGKQDIQQEFTVIKKAYFRGVLVAHPDKGGDAKVFRELQQAWEVSLLRYKLFY